MLVAAVSVFEAFSIFSSNAEDKTSGYLFVGVALFAFVRYMMLRRRQFIDKKNNGGFEK